MKVKASAVLLASGLLATFAGPAIATIHTTDQSGVATYPAFFFGVFIAVIGLLLLVAGVYRFARNIDLAAAKYVDGVDPTEMHKPSFAERRDARIDAAQV